MSAITEETNPYCGEIEVEEIKCSEIRWKPGKNVTVEIVTKKVKGGGAKKQKQKGKEKEEPRPSFFRHFFRNMKPDSELVEMLMQSDHEVGTVLRNCIIPWAVRWYTGEAAPDYEPMGDADADEESEEDDDDEESEEEAPPRRGKGGGPKAAAKKAGGKPKGSPQTKPGEPPKEECKQQ